MDVYNDPVEALRVAMFPLLFFFSRCLPRPYMVAAALTTETAHDGVALSGKNEQASKDQKGSRNSVALECCRTISKGHRGPITQGFIKCWNEILK